MLNFDNKIYSDLTYLGCAESYLEEILDNIDQVSLLQTFNTNELKVLSHYLHCYAAPRGYMLFEQGNLADHLIILLSGKVTLHYPSLDGVDSQNKSYGIGTALGASSLVERQAWKASCSTDVPADIAVLSRDSLNQILVHNPRLGNKLLLALMQVMATELRDNIAKHYDNESVALN